VDGSRLVRVSDAGGEMSDLFGGLEESFREEWRDMPEFIQGKQEPYAKIIVRFSCKEDLEEFAKLIGQKLTPNTKSIWHPQLTRGLNSNLRYVDES
jgi:hypothetical protein